MGVFRKVVGVGFLGVCALAMIGSSGSNTSAQSTASETTKQERTYRPVNPDNLKIAVCHGYSEGGHWHLHVSDFSQDELNFANNAALSIKAIDPENKDEQIDMLVFLDQFACKGVPYVQTFRNIEQMARAAVDLRKPNSETRKQLMDAAKNGVDVGPQDDGKI